MEAVFLKLLNMSLTASLLVAVVLLLRLLLVRAPKWIRGILWAMVALRLLLPFSLESALSLLPSAEPIPPEILSPVSDSSVNADTLPELPVLPDDSDIETNPTRPAPSLNETVNSVLIETMPPQIAETENPVLTLTQIFSVVWLVGIGLMLVYTLVSYLRIRMRVSESLDLDDGIFLCDRIGTPFIIGIIRPRIYLPSTMADSDIPYVLAHERAHLRRLDYLWKPLGFLILSVYWFNPVIWVAYILFCRDIELACDEKVVAKLGTKIKKPYSEALINCSVPRKMISACPLAFGESSIKGRIKSVLNYKKPALWIIIAALVLCTAAGVFFLTNPQEQAEHNANGGSDLDGLSLEFISFTNDPDAPSPVLEIRWNNQSDEDITFGAAYTLYRYEGDELVDCRDTEPIWHLVGYLLRAHTFNTREYGLFDIDLSKPGRYRFESEFTLDKDSGTANRKEYVAWVEFELGEEDIVVTDDQSSEEESSLPEPTGDFDIDEPIVLARSDIKFPNGPTPYYLTLEMVDGRFCKGGEDDLYNNNYEGTAELRLYDIETDELIDRKPVQFYEDTPMLFSGEFRFALTNYNSDNQPDFSLGQYYDDKHYSYHFYFVSSEGTIGEFTIEPELFLSATDGFSEMFGFNTPWIGVPVYDEERGEFTYNYRFDFLGEYRLEFVSRTFNGEPTYSIKGGKLVSQKFYNSLSLPRESVYATESDVAEWEELLYSGKVASLGFAESYTYEASDFYLPNDVTIPIDTANLIWGKLQQTPLDIYTEPESIATGGGASYIFGYDENGEVLFYIEDGGHFTITYPGENKRLIFNNKKSRTDLNFWSDLFLYANDYPKDLGLRIVSTSFDFDDMILLDRTFPAEGMESLKYPDEVTDETFYRLTLFKKDGKIGVIDHTGNIIYNTDTPVRLCPMCGIVSETQNAVLSPLGGVVNEVHAHGFSSNYSYDVENDSLFKTDWVSPLSNIDELTLPYPMMLEAIKSATVTGGEYTSYERYDSPRYMLIGTNGNPISDEQFLNYRAMPDTDFAADTEYWNGYSFSYQQQTDVFAVQTLDGRWKFIDANGNDLNLGTFEDAFTFHEGVAAVNKDGRWGFINRSGETVIPFK
ncbi:MAG: WG repeat-containing protein, partial [Oscillospiraceae bacterium]|nr:WG repeat-containing protein [Oscillospiraceae bacterium]